MSGLLDFLTDPQIQKQIADRRLLVGRFALHGQLEQAKHDLDFWDAVAIDTFHIGNSIPRNTLH
jgi:hypothetical protein